MEPDYEARAQVFKALCDPRRQRILELLQIAPHFQAVIGGDGAFPLKPEPDALHHLRQLAGTAPEETLMVGDHYTDLEAARRAGIPAVYAAYGFGDPQQEPYVFKAESFAGLVDWLKPERPMEAKIENREPGSEAARN